MNYCSIYHINAPLTEELEALLARHPTPANHDGMHYVFASAVDTENPIIIDELVDSEGELLTGDALAWYMAKILATDESAVFWASVPRLEQLHNHAAWRIWRAKYDHELEGEGRKQFKSDWLYVEQMIAAAMPEAAASWPAYSDSMTYQQGRAIVLSAIQANAAG